MREIPLRIVKAMGIWRPFEGMPRGEVILHEARWEAVEVMWMRRLIELRVLLVRRERPSKVRWALHTERGFSLAPGPWRLLMLVVPGSFKLIIPGWVRLVVPGSFTLIVPARLPLFVPHPLVVTVPWRTVGRTLVVWEWRLIGGLQKERHRVS